MPGLSCFGPSIARRCCKLVFLTCLFSSQLSQAKEGHAPVLTVKRGLTGQVTFTHPDPTLRAVPDQAMDAEVLVRLERSTEVPDRYLLSFFGAVAGDYDLSRWVVQQDGSPLTVEHGIPPMIVRVVSELPPEHGTSLYEIDDPQVRAPGGYVFALVSFALLWAAVPVIWWIVRLSSRQPMESPPSVPTPTLADRLRPLVDRASQGALTVEEQSQLELMLYVFWQRQLGLPKSLPVALPILRQHAEAGGLLRKLEAWIHADKPNSNTVAQSSLSPATMEALLAPYHASSRAAGHEGTHEQAALSSTGAPDLGDSV